MRAAFEFLGKLGVEYFCFHDRDIAPEADTLAETNRRLDEIVALGYDRETVSDVLRMVDRAEYKRRQAAPGVRITPRAFGKDRRLPITNRYREK